MNKFAPLYVVIAAAMWGADGVLLRPYLYNLPVPLVVFTESLFAAIILSPVLFKNFNELKKLTKSEWFAFLGIAALGGAIGTMAITRALFYVNFVNLSIVVLLQKLQPLFALILAMIFLKEKLPPRFFYWSALAIAGAVIMTFGENLFNIETGDETIAAAGFSLIAALSFAASTVLSKKALNSVSFSLSTNLRFTVTVLVMLVAAGITGSFSSVSNITTIQFWIFVFIAFTTGGFAIFLYYYGLQKISASVATICELAFPLTAVLLEYFLRGNVMGRLQWIGVIMLILGILKVSGIKKKPQD